jgi:hypothetical protein
VRATYACADSVDAIVVNDDVVELAIGSVRADQVVNLWGRKSLICSVVEQDGVAVAIEKLILENRVEVDDIELGCHCWPALNLRFKNDVHKNYH